jgi:hypothetical protein
MSTAMRQSVIRPSACSRSIRELGKGNYIVTLSDVFIQAQIIAVEMQTEEENVHINIRPETFNL